MGAVTLDERRIQAHLGASLGGVEQVWNGIRGDVLEAILKDTGPARGGGDIDTEAERLMETVVGARMGAPSRDLAAFTSALLRRIYISPASVDFDVAQHMVRSALGENGLLSELHEQLLIMTVDRHTIQEEAQQLGEWAHSGLVLDAAAGALRTRTLRLLGVATDAAEPPWRQRLGLSLAKACAQKLGAALIDFDYFDNTRAPGPNTYLLDQRRQRGARMAMSDASDALTGRLMGAASTTLAAARHAQRRAVSEAIVGAPVGKPSSNDPAGMSAACPLMPGGKADDESRRLLVTAAAPAGTASATVIPPEWGVGVVGSEVAPFFVGSALRALHQSSELEPCSHCAMGACYIDTVVQLADQAPVIFYAGERPAGRYRAQEGDGPIVFPESAHAGAASVGEVPTVADEADIRREQARHRGKGYRVYPHEYPLTQDEQARLRRDLAELLASGRAELISPLSVLQPGGIAGAMRAAYPHVISPVFYAYRHRYCDEADLTAAFQGDPAATAAYFAARGEAMVDGAVRIAAKEGRHDDVLARDLVRAMASAVKDSKPRLVFDYGPNNRAGTGWPMAMPSPQDIFSMVDVGYWVASADVKNGFHHVRMHPHDRAYKAFAGAGYLLQPTRLMFGLRQAPALFCTLTAEVVALCRRWADRKHAGQGIRFVCYVDDIFIIAPTRGACEAGVEVLKAVGERVGMLLSEAKMRAPAQRAIPVLGLELDTIDMVVSIPQAKRYRNLVLLHTALAAARRGVVFPVELLRKLAGLLTHCTSVLWDGVMWLAPLWCAAASSDAQLSLAERPLLVAALEEWATLMADSSRARAPILASPAAQGGMPWVTSRSDASGDVGFALAVGGIALWGTWKEAARLRPGSDGSIGQLELYPLLLLELLAGDLLDGFFYRPLLDNVSDVFCLLKGHTDDQAAQPLLTAILGLSRSPAGAGIGGEPACGHAVLPGWSPREVNQFGDDGSKAESPHKAKAVVAAYLRAPIGRT